MRFDSHAGRAVRLVAVAALAMITAVVTSRLTAGAATSTTPLTQFTGCLKAGALSNLAAGGSPSAACATGATQVHLSAALTAGSGLTVTGGNSLSVNPAKVQSRVTGNCPAGFSVSAVSSAGTVTCHAGAMSAVLDLTTSNDGLEIGLPGGDSVINRCTVTGNLGFPEAELEIANLGAATYYAHGSVDAQVAASTWYLDAATTQSLGAGHTLLGKAPPSDYFEIQAKPVSSSTPAYSTVHLLVNNGSKVFTVDASLYSATDRCQEIVEVTPSS